MPLLGTNLGYPHLGNNLGHPIWKPVWGTLSGSQSGVHHLGASLGYPSGSKSWHLLLKPICGTPSENQSGVPQTSFQMGRPRLAPRCGVPGWIPDLWSPIWESFWGAPSGSKFRNPFWEQIPSTLSRNPSGEPPSGSQSVSAPSWC